MHVLSMALTLLHIAGAGDDPVPAGLRCLQAAYPEAVAGVTPTSLTLTDGTVIPWDDGREKDLAARLADPDLQDQMVTPYPAGADWIGPPAEGQDPGRARHDGFFRGVYGATRREVEEKSVVVRWMPETTKKMVRITTVGGVHEKVRAISDALDRLPKHLRKFVAEPSSFHWRTIKGTDRLSTHSFAIAIDVGVEISNYWRWDLREGVSGIPKWRSKIPMEIVGIFEHHGFIWGGKWSHYDTMHFEYRPELLHPLCAGDAVPQTLDGMWLD
ncbi:MAG: M15 family metallopeptidase [Pseudomonadota bacterium]